MFISAGWTGFITPPKWTLWFIFLTELRLSAAEEALAGGVAHPGSDARWLQCSSSPRFELCQSQDWMVPAGRWPGRNLNSSYSESEQSSFHLQLCLKQEYELGDVQSNTSLNIQLLCSFLQPEFGDFLSINFISIISFNCYYLLLSSINLSNLPMNLFIFQSP